MRMKCASALLAATACASFYFMQSAWAGVVAEHSGATDPVTEGWTLNPSVPPSGTSVGAVINDGGTDAWQVLDHTTTGGVIYSYVPTATQISNGNLYGWSLSSRVRVVEASADRHEDMLFLYRDGVTSWDVRFGQQADGDPIVYLVTTGPNSGWSSYALEGAAGTYHDYELRFDPSVGTADLFVDGIERISDYGGFAIAQTFVLWGAGASFDQGVANYASVQLEVGSADTVPEPGTLALLGVGLAWFGRYRSRSRMRTAGAIPTSIPQV